MKGSMPRIMSRGNSSCRALLAGLTRRSLIQGNFAISALMKRSGTKPTMNAAAICSFAPIGARMPLCATAALTNNANVTCRKEGEKRDRRQVEIGDAPDEILQRPDVAA